MAINYPSAERRAIILSYDRHIDLIMESLRSRLVDIKNVKNPCIKALLKTFQDHEKRDLADSLNERLALCEQYSRSKR